MASGKGTTTEFTNEFVVQLITDIVARELAVSSASPPPSPLPSPSPPHQPGSAGAPTIPVGLSNRHLHISRADCDALFGTGYELTPLRDLSQPGQYAAEETVDLVGPKRTLHGVRILGPVRPVTQIEISPTDGYVLGLHPPVRLSGDLDGTPGIHLIGPRGAVRIDKGVIVAARHMHMTPADAATFGIEDKAVVSVRIEGARPVLFDDVHVRVSPKYATELHLDIDEGNAAYIGTGDRAQIVTDLCTDLCTGWCATLSQQHWNGAPRHPNLQNPDFRPHER